MGRRFIVNDVTSYAFAREIRRQIIPWVTELFIHGHPYIGYLSIILPYSDTQGVQRKQSFCHF